MRKTFLAKAAALILISSNILTAAETAYVCNPDGGVDGTVSVIDVATNTVTATIPTLHPSNVVATPNGEKFYVGNLENGSIAVFNGTNNTLLTTIGSMSAGPFCSALGVTPDGSQVYAALANDFVVLVIDVATDTIIQTIPSIYCAPQGAITIGNTVNGLYAYVNSSDMSTIYAINTANFSVTPISDPDGAGEGAAITPDGTKVYASNTNPSGSVSIVDTSTNTILSGIGFPIPVGSLPTGVAITSDGSKIFVANYNDNNLSVIDIPSDTVIYTIPVHDHPFYIAISGDNSKAYVTCNGTDLVDVIDIASGAVVDSITVGPGPFGISITSGPEQVPVSGVQIETVA